MTGEITRMSAKPPWACPRWNCCAKAGEPCRTNSGSKTKTLPQMHIVRWEARPVDPWPGYPK